MSAKKRIVITALGRQGWAITRQLVHLLGDEDYTLYVYDKVRAHEEERLLSSLRSANSGTSGSTMSAVQKAYHEGRIKKIRELKPELDKDDISDKELKEVIVWLEPDLIINAATFTGHELYTKIAFQADADYIDLGQDTWRAMGQRAWDQRIVAEGRSMRLVPEAGLAPGLVNILGDWLLQSGGDSLYIRVGGLPIHAFKGGELHYGASWSLEGVVKEYTDTTIMRRNGHLVPVQGLYAHDERENPGQGARGVDPLQIRNMEIIERIEEIINQIDREAQNATDDQARRKAEEHLAVMRLYFAQNGSADALEIRSIEACPTSDGISLMPFDEGYVGVPNLDYKTLRYAGHFDCVEQSIEDDTLKEKIKNVPSASPDLVLLRVWSEQNGIQKRMVECIVLGDPQLDNAGPEEEPELGPEQVFTAMQHLTGWPTVLMAQALLNSRPYSAESRPKLFGKDRTLWSGRRLEDVLAKGGVIMPYELVDGGELLSELTSGNLIPQCEFHSL
ncbi:MAG TPA: hypothetical protein VGE45_20930 [Chloroflexia bacterium]|jgi:hypothetical protein